MYPLGPQDSSLLAHCPIPLISIHRGLLRSPAPLSRTTIPLSLVSYICSGSILAKPKVSILTFSNTGHSHRICTDVSFSVSHLLHEGVFVLLILCSMYCRLIHSVRSPTNILQCFRSSLLMNWTYLSVGLSRHSWLVPYSSQTFHSVCFLFSIKFLILDLNLLKDSGRKGSSPMIGLVLAPSLASLSAVLFCWITLCPGTRIIVTSFTWLSAFLYSPLQAVILYHWLLGL